MILRKFRVSCGSMWTFQVIVCLFVLASRQLEFGCGAMALGQM